MNAFFFRSGISFAVFRHHRFKMCPVAHSTADVSTSTDSCGTFDSGESKWLRSRAPFAWAFCAYTNSNATSQPGQNSFSDGFYGFVIGHQRMLTSCHYNLWLCLNENNFASMLRSMHLQSHSVIVSMRNAAADERQRNGTKHFGITNVLHSTVPNICLLFNCVHHGDVLTTFAWFHCCAGAHSSGYGNFLRAF